MVWTSINIIINKNQKSTPRLMQWTSPNDDNAKQIKAYNSHSTYYIWTNKEEELLLAAINKHGKNWRLVQELYFKKLNPAQVKNKYYVLKRRFMPQPEDRSLPSLSDKTIIAEQDQFYNPNLIEPDKKLRASSLLPVDDMLKTLQDIFAQLDENELDDSQKPDSKQ